MKSKLWNSEDVLLVRINIDVVGRAGKSRGLNEGADRSRIVALDVAFVLCPKTFDVPVISGKLSAPAADIKGVAANEFFFFRIFQVLPARRPGYGRIGDVVGSGRLAQQLRQVSIAGGTIQVIAQVAPQLSAGICNPCRPVL